MDSGNSGSMQSSSGGHDDYDPRAAADSSFIRPIFNPPPPPTTMFDPTNNYLSNFFDPSSLQIQYHHINNPFFTPQSQTLLFPPHHFTQNTTPLPRNETAGAGLSSDQNQTTQVAVARNPKKRSRASRRAPTTVLTTDTTNFRAMVQEFTGIPAPPFTSSSTFPRNRLHLFSTPSSLRSNQLNISQTPSSYHNLLLRPLPQKHPPSSSNLSNDHVNNITQSPFLLSNSSELGQGMTQMQNPIQSFLQSSSSFGSKNQQNSSLGLSHGQVNNANMTGLPDLISPENGNNFLQNVTNGKQNNYAATNFQNGKKRTDNLSISATRGTTSEGMMEPWICSSD